MDYQAIYNMHLLRERLSAPAKPGLSQLPSVLAYVTGELDAIEEAARAEMVAKAEADAEAKAKADADAAKAAADVAAAKAKIDADAAAAKAKADEDAAKAKP